MTLGEIILAHINQLVEEEEEDCCCCHDEEVAEEEIESIKEDD